MLYNDERYLSTHVLVIGTGGAGLRACIELAEAGLDVLAVGKRRKHDAHTTLAAGGINAPWAPWIRRIPGSSTPPTRSRSLFCWPTREWWKPWLGACHKALRIWNAGVARSPGTLTVGSASVSSAPTLTAAQPLPGTTPGLKSNGPCSGVPLNFT
ncbi:hypothetical protein ART_0403 [Arthrobacter sp. PAMC 25486]|nr:hypothetical protein ART_0403 [Arthrobacter sp. PAMC 25486]